MRTPITAALLATLATLALGGLACQGDPNDPMTWAKQLKDLRVQKEALDHLANMDVEKARPAVPALIDLYNDAKRPEFLETLARYQDPRTKQIMIEALDRNHLLEDLARTLSDSGVNIVGGSMQTLPDGVVRDRFTLEVGDVRQLDNILANIRSIHTVYDAYRVVAS